MANKCKYAEMCDGYQPYAIIRGKETGVTCNKQPGNYCGKFREFAAIGGLANA